MVWDMINGIYEQLICKLVDSELKKVNKEQFFVKESPIEKSEASKLLSQYLSEVINYALGLITDDIEQQIDVSNKIILLLKDELKNENFENDLIAVNGRILNAIFSKLNSNVVNYEDHLKKITPFTRLTQSELFTGSNIGISLESELKKEILSSDKIYFLVSFIKWSGIRIFENELREFTQRGNKLRVITTSIGHRLRPPFISKSLSIDMRIKCLTRIDIHDRFKCSLNSIVSKYKSQLIACIFSENSTPS